MRSRLAGPARLVLAAAALAAIACLAAPAAFAEGPATRPPAFVVHVEHALPSQVAAYEATTKEFISLVEANRDVMPGFAFTALAGDDLSYAFISPVAGFAEIGTIFGQFMALAEKLGPRWGELMERAGATFDHVDEWLFIELT